MDSISSVAAGGHSSTAARSSAALNEPVRRLPAIPTMRMSGMLSLRWADLEKPGGVAAHDQVLVRFRNPRGAANEIDRMLHAHVVGIVGTQHHMICTVAVDQVLQHGAVEGDGVEVELFQVARRFSFN